MRVELVSTGDELVTGLIADTNSPYLEARLFALGLKVERVQVVGDVKADITRALLEASARAEAVLVCGGLGPTADDHTAECAAAAAGVPLVEDARVLEALRERARRRGRELTPAVARMARVPEGAEVVLNPVGAAPMFVVRLGGCRLFFLPGVPREYRALVDGEVLPRLRAELESRPGRAWRAFRLLRTAGVPESVVDGKVMPLARAHPRVAIGLRALMPEVHVELAAQGGSQAEADAALAAVEAAVREALGPAVYGADGEEYAQVLGRMLVEANATVALAESCTGGLIAQQLTAVPGASRYVVGGAVVYTEKMKARWAHVPEQLLARHGAVSREVAVALAEGIRSECGATYGLSVTGFAGPDGGTAADPVGTVYCALAGPGGPTRCERLQLLGDREQVRLFAAHHALELLRERLLAGPASV